MTSKKQDKNKDEGVILQELPEQPAARISVTLGSFTVEVEATDSKEEVTRWFNSLLKSLVKHPMFRKHIPKLEGYG